MSPTGYDMYIQNDIPGEAEAVETLRAQWDVALKVRNAFPKEAQGSYQEGVDSDRFTWGGTFANADPAYAVAQAEVMRISDEMDLARRSYFRLNIWGMARYRDVMEAIGMGYWADHPDWGKGGDYPSDEHRWAAMEALDNCAGDVVAALGHQHGYDGVTLTPELIEQARLHREASDAVRRAHPGETPGIPLVKFTSNDGWLVTPVECSSALQWLDFLETGLHFGGFAVH